MCLINSANGQNIDSIAMNQVDSLIKLCKVYRDKQDGKSAFETIVLAESIALDKFGKNSKEYGACCNNHAVVLELFSKDIDETIRWYKLAISIREVALGKSHIDYCISLVNLGTVYGKMNNFTLAEPLIIEAKNNLELSNNKDHKLYTFCLNNLGIINMENRKYDVAERYYLEAKDIREKLSGKLTVEYCGNLINLAKLYFNMAYYEKAEPLLLEAIQIFKVNIKTLNHPFYSNSLTQLSLMYNKLGKFNKAEQLFLENLSLIEKNIGVDNEKYAANLNNMAMLHMDLGNYEKSEKYFLEAKAIKQKIVGITTVNYVSTIQNLAILYSKMGDFIKSEEYYLETKYLLDSVKQTNHPDYADLLNNLGSVYYYLKRYNEAESHYLMSIELHEKLFNADRPEFASALENLANLYMKLGEYSKAEPLIEKAKNKIEGAFGKQHLEYTQAIFNLANLYFLKEDFNRCNFYLNELDTLDRALVKMATQHLSENELQKYISIFSRRQNFMFSIAHNISISNEIRNFTENTISQTCYNSILFYKGILSDMVENTKILAALDSSAFEKFNLHRSYLRSLAQQYSKIKSDRDSNYVVDLEMKANALEKDLRRTVQPYQNRFQQLNWKDIQNKLRQNEACIEYIYYNYSLKGLSDSNYYAAMILTKDIAKPYFLPLFEESKLNSFFLTKGENKTDYVNAIYTMQDRGIVNQESNQMPMYELIWKPLEGLLKGINKIYFSPSGLLHRINLNAVPISNEETLADRYQYIELNSTRKLLDDNEIIINNNDAVLYGGINFEKDTTLSKMESTSNDVAMASRSVSEFSFNSIESTLRGGSWAYLLGTEREVNALEKIMQSAKVSVKLVKGFAATEESIKSIGKNKMPSPRMLHIATHGYFFPDPKVNTVFGSLNNQESNVFKTSDHPMMRSGLIMSGGNAAWNKMNSSNDKEDGILTAYEISQMDLSNTELVVLSACETGLGDIQGNEGVYGLQRAFKIAGAKYLIMSLWQVPDKQTSLLMTTFYKKWLVDKLSIPLAFQGAQKELREMGFDPYQWAGFILVE